MGKRQLSMSMLYKRQVSVSILYERQVSVSMLYGRRVSVSMLYKRQVSVSMLYERQVARKARVIARDPSHTLTEQYQFLPSGPRFKTPKVSTARAAQEFVPSHYSLLTTKT